MKRTCCDCIVQTERKKEKEEYLKGIYSEQDFLLQNFTCILNETIDYHLPGKQTVKNSILHWVYKKLIPNFLIKTRKEIDSMDIIHWLGF